LEGEIGSVNNESMNREYSENEIAAERLRISLHRSSSGVNGPVLGEGYLHVFHAAAARAQPDSCRRAVSGAGRKRVRLGERLRLSPTALTGRILLFVIWHGFLLLGDA
jgi:hypothetical protein